MTLLSREPRDTNRQPGVVPATGHLSRAVRLCLVHEPRDRGSEPGLAPAARRSPLCTRHSKRPGFTLVELLVVITIIAILSGVTLFALRGVQDEARERRTRAIVTRINELIMTRWESYRTRAVPVRIPAQVRYEDGTIKRMDPRTAATIRLAALRKLMRMELPDRKSDLLYAEDYGGTNLDQQRFPLESPPTLWRAYRRRASQQIIGHYGLAADDDEAWKDDDRWTPQYRNAECLYLILATIRDGDSTGLDSFREAEIGDVDNDGMPEILDAWGTPIRFLRWAPGFRSDIQQGDLAPEVDGNAGLGNGDPFDPLKVDWAWNDGVEDNDPFLMFPLIYSAGPDKQYDIGDNFQEALVYEDPPTAPEGMNSPNNPYMVSETDGMIGDPIDADENGVLNHTDNITNHLLEVR